MVDVKPKRLALWTTARCLSTAMVMSFGNYGNVEVFNELYAGAATFGPDCTVQIPMSFSFDDEMTFDSVKFLLEAEYPNRDLVFLKDHAHAVTGKYDKLPSGFVHAFIIRNPQKTVPSGVKLTSKVGMTIEQHLGAVRAIGMKGFGFGDLVDLANHLQTTTGQPVTILDADDLLEDPEKMLRAFCKAVNLPFRNSLLKWEPITEIPWHNSKSMIAVHKANGAYENALKSSGWITTNRKAADLTGAPQIMLDCIDEAMPYYQTLYEKRLNLDY